LDDKKTVTSKTGTVLHVTKFKPRVPIQKKAGHLDLIQHVEEKEEETPMDSVLDLNIVDNKNIVENWDAFDPYSCVSCGLPFDSKLGRLPFLLPCRHNACLNCLKQKLENEMKDFDCPIDNCFVQNLEEVKENKLLFQKVKT